MVAQLFFTPFTCGAASFIAANKAGILGDRLHPILVNLRAHTIMTGDRAGQDFKAVNPKGNVPTLLLDDQTLLNEGAAVLQWIADQAPDSGLAPPWGTSARYLLQSKLNWLASELHTACETLFPLKSASEMREAGVAKLKTKLQYLSDVELAGEKDFLVGDGFTVADAYAYILLSWLERFFSISLKDYPVLKRYYDQIALIDCVQDAHAKMADIAASTEWTAATHV